jgi:hypothetical protein
MSVTTMIEATHSELKRSHDIGKLRVRRSTKVCFAVACKVIACNIEEAETPEQDSATRLFTITFINSRLEAISSFSD